jgi:tetratricopeptide (TPR) repeat protein
MNILHRLFKGRQRVIPGTSVSAPSFDYAAPLDYEDIVFLRAQPISRKRMDLLWYTSEQLASLEEPLAQKGVVTIEWSGSAGIRTHEITQEDLEWAKQIDPIVMKAYNASHQEEEDHAASIHYYKEALRLAPGCDLFLMSIGVSYALLNQYVKGLQYLTRAALISLSNNRILRNLEDVLDSLIKAPNASAIKASNERVVNILVALLQHADSYIADGTTASLIKRIGDDLCLSGGKKRMKDIARLVRIARLVGVAGRPNQDLDFYWEGVCGWRAREI